MSKPRVLFEDWRPAYINHRHVDGPMLSMCDGRVHWLTWWERLMVALGREDAESLELKYWVDGDGKTAHSIRGEQ